MRRRKLLFLGLGILFLAVAVGVVYQRATRVSRTVLLLPEGNLVFYANLKPAPFVNLAELAGADKWKDPDQNLRELATKANFHVDKDLDEIALSFSSAPSPAMSMVLRGTFDQERLKKYVQEFSTTSESYAGRTILTIKSPLEQRTFICVIDSRTLALAGSQGVIHTIIDKAIGRLQLGVPPPLIRDYYPRVPFGSVAWLICLTPEAQPGKESPFDVLTNSTAVVSLRYFGSTQLRAEFNSANATDAGRLAKNIEDFLASTRASVVASTSDNRSLITILAETRVRQEGPRTVLDLKVSDEMMRKVFSSFNR